MADLVLLDDSELQRPFIRPLCPICKHAHESEGPVVSCGAYPAGIPAEIITGEVDHNIYLKGDRGIKFEPREN